MRKPTSKEDFFIWSYLISLALVLLEAWQQTKAVPDGAGLFRLLLSALIPAIFLFLYWLFVRWVATTAERASRSFVSFMIFAIVAPLIAWIIVIMFKKSDSA
jgi:uncharacterized membrane-anchored protein